MNKTVKRIIKIGLFIGAVAGTMHAVNKYIEKATSNLNKLKDNKESYYKWPLGNIYYEKTGTGSPILLIHDYTPYASSYEWNTLAKTLSENHTVYTLDLLGCGRSDKPAISCTNFMYVQMITDFINDVIGEKTDIITSGYSSSIAIMSTNYTCEKINNLVLINPADMNVATKSLGKCSKVVKTVLEIPILGTFLYNMFTLRKNLDNLITEEYFHDDFHSHDDIVDAYYEAAHRGNGNGRYVLASIIGNYMEANIPHALKACENNILILGGKHQDDISDIIENYKELKSEIKSSIIMDAKKLPHYEVPEDVVEEIDNFLNN